MKKLMISTSFVLLAALAACGQQPTKSTEPQPIQEEQATPEQAALRIAVAGEWRKPDDVSRDVWRHPVQTIEFFGMKPDMTVVEIWPGGGWYADIIAPYLASGGGKYIAAGFDPANPSERVQNGLAAFRERYVENPTTFGNVEMTVLSNSSDGVAADGSADMVVSFRNVHNWMSGNYADKAFADFYKALKPGGVLGLVEHRGSAETDQDPNARSGYVRQDYVIAMAEKAGFVFEASSDVNANPADTKDHPFGVWTLPPVGRTSPFGEDANPDFDRTTYDAIGESDRMTLRFRKPVEVDGAALQ